MTDAMRSTADFLADSAPGSRGSQVNGTIANGVQDMRLLRFFATFRHDIRKNDSAVSWLALGCYTNLHHFATTLKKRFESKVAAKW